MWYDMVHLHTSIDLHEGRLLQQQGLKPLQMNWDRAKLNFLSKLQAEILYSLRLPLLHFTITWHLYQQLFRLFTL